jgi:hypothetical protein
MNDSTMSTIDKTHPDYIGQAREYKVGFRSGECAERDWSEWNSKVERSEAFKHGFADGRRRAAEREGLLTDYELGMEAAREGDDPKWLRGGGLDHLKRGSLPSLNYLFGYYCRRFHDSGSGGRVMAAVHSITLPQHRDEVLAAISQLPPEALYALEIAIMRGWPGVDYAYPPEELN